MVGGYIKKYDLHLNVKNPFLLLIGLILFCSLFIGVTETIVSHEIYVKLPHHNDLSVFFAIVFFVIIKDWAVKENTFTRFVGRLAPFSLGVYLIHANSYVDHYLWGWVKDVILPDFTSWTAFPLSLLIPSIVFLICAFLDYLVKQIMAILSVETYVGRLFTRIDHLADDIIK